jgi:LysR family transcriptional regulator, glycine cleavage system transcriptional activator
MSRHLPPLNTLRSFEAAARFASFSKAADELHVTHGAVSRSIAQLEDFLGLKLFQRKTRQVLLTPAGAVYAARVREALDRLAGATLALTRDDDKGHLSVSTFPSFAAKWLVPRLFRFRRAHPGIDMRLETTERLTDFDADGIDIAVRFGRGNYPGLTTALLLREEVFPACSPRLVEGTHPLREPDDLALHTLIHDDFPIDWAGWLRMAGVSSVDAHRGPVFSSSVLAMQAAVQGDGVVLARSGLAADDLAAGRLVKPFDLSMPSDFAYYAVCPPRALERKRVKAFRDWLLSEAGVAPAGIGDVA